MNETTSFADRCTRDAKSVLRRADEVACEMGLPFAGTAHLLLGVASVCHTVGHAALNSALGRPDGTAFQRLYRATVEALAPGEDADFAPRPTSIMRATLPYSPGAAKVLDGAVRIACAMGGHREVGTADLLLSLLYCTDEGSSARGILRRLGAGRAAIAAEVWSLLGRLPDELVKGLPGGDSLSPAYRKLHHVDLEMLKIVNPSRFASCTISIPDRDRDGDVIDPCGVAIFANGCTFERHGDQLRAKRHLSQEEIGRLKEQLEKSPGLGLYVTAPSGPTVSPEPDLLRRAATMLRDMAQRDGMMSKDHNLALAAKLPEQNRSEFMKMANKTAKTRRDRAFAMADRLDNAALEPELRAKHEPKPTAAPGAWLDVRQGSPLATAEQIRAMGDEIMKQRRGIWCGETRLNWMDAEFASLNWSRWQHLGRPNDRQTWDQLFDDAGRDLLVTGVAYLWEVRSNLWTVDSVHHLPTPAVMVRRRGNGEVMDYRIDMNEARRLTPGKEWPGRQWFAPGTYAAIAPGHVKAVRLPIGYLDKLIKDGRSSEFQDGWDRLVDDTLRAFSLTKADLEADVEIKRTAGLLLPAAQLGLPAADGVTLDGQTNALEEPQPDAVIEGHKTNAIVAQDIYAMVAACEKATAEAMEGYDPKNDPAAALTDGKPEVVAEGAGTWKGLAERIVKAGDGPPMPDYLIARPDLLADEQQPDPHAGDHPPTDAELAQMHQAVNAVSTPPVEGDSEVALLAEAAGQCPRGHHKLEGKCRRDYCSCRCARCEQECGEARS